MASDRGRRGARRRSLGAAGTVAVAVAALTAAHARAEVEAFPETDRRAKVLAALPKLDASIAAEVAAQKVPGLVFGVVLDGELSLDDPAARTLPELASLRSCFTGRLARRRSGTRGWLRVRRVVRAGLQPRSGKAFSSAAEQVEALAAV